MSTHLKRSVDHCHIEERKATKTLMLVNLGIVNCCFASVFNTYIEVYQAPVGLRLSFKR